MKIYKESRGYIKVKAPKQQNVQGFVLHPHEIRILEQIFIHRYMRAADLIDLNMMFRKMMGFPGGTRNSVSQRLYTLSRSGVLKLRQNNVMKNSGFKFNSFFYTLDHRGLEVLVRLQLIDEMEAKRFTEVLKKISLPSTHTMAASTLANNIFMYLWQTERITEKSRRIQIMRGSQHPLLGTVAEVPGTIKGLIVPDYIVETPSTLIAIEVDSGRQGKNVLVNKVRRYMKYLETPYAQDKDFYIIFSPIDYSVAKYTEPSTRFKRAAYIKTIFDSYESWPNKMHIYSTPAVHVPELISRITDDNEYFDASYQSFLTDEWIEYVRVLLGRYGYEVGTFDESEISPILHIDSHNADGFIWVKKPHKKKRYYIVLRMNSGAVRSYERYHVYLSRCEQINESEHSNVKVGIILLYDEPSCLESELLDVENISNVEVLLTDKNSWLELLQNHRAQSKSITLPFWEFGRNFTKISVEKEVRA